MRLVARAHLYTLSAVMATPAYWQVRARAVSLQRNVPEMERDMKWISRAYKDSEASWKLVYARPVEQERGGGLSARALQ